MPLRNGCCTDGRQADGRLWPRRPGLRGWRCVLSPPNIRIEARPANTVGVALRTDNIKPSLHDERDALHTRRDFWRQVGEGGPLGWLGPSRIPTGVGYRVGSAGRVAEIGRSAATKCVGGAAKLGAWARPRQHSCGVPAGEGWLPSCAVLGRHIAAQLVGAPERIRVACASGCRKLRVIARSAVASATARQH